MRRSTRSTSNTARPAIRNSLASLQFNTGGSATAGRHRARRRGEGAGDWGTAKQIFRQYTKAGGQDLHGLQIRRDQEAQAFKDPNFYKSGQGTTAAQDWGGKQDPRSVPAAPAAPSTPASQQLTPEALQAKGQQILSQRQPGVADDQTAQVPKGPQSNAPDAQLRQPTQFAPDPRTDPQGYAAAKAQADANMLSPQPISGPSGVGPAAPTAAPANSQAPAMAQRAPAAAAAAAQPAPVSNAPAPAAASQAPAPAPKPARVSGIDAAHKLLDTKVSDLVKQHAPDQAANVPGFIGDKTLRQAIDTPLLGGQIKSGILPHLNKLGIAPADLDKAIASPPGKRSEGPAQTSSELLAQAEPSGQQPAPTGPQYAQATPTVMTDASPAPAQAAPPQMTPELAKAIVGAVDAKDAAALQAPPSPPGAQPVVMPADVAPPAPGAPGGPVTSQGGAMTLPAGNAPVMMTQASQGNPIAMAGLAPPPVSPQMTSPLAPQTFPNALQPPIPSAEMQGWGWSGADAGGGWGGWSGGGFDGGLDFGGFAGGE